MRCICLVMLGVVCLSVSGVRAQDPVTVDPQHHKIEFENEQVRVLRITYGPHEKDAGMPEHPNFVVVALTDYAVKIIFPDGKTEEGHGKAGQVTWWPATKHLVEILSDKPTEFLAIELKTKAAGAAKSGAAR